MQISQNCPMCKMSTTTNQCPNCGYDYTLDFTLYATANVLSFQDIENFEQHRKVILDKIKAQVMVQEELKKQQELQEKKEAADRKAKEAEEKKKQEEIERLAAIIKEQSIKKQADEQEKAKSATPGGASSASTTQALPKSKIKSTMPMSDSSKAQTTQTSKASTNNRPPLSDNTQYKNVKISYGKACKGGRVPLKDQKNQISKYAILPPAVPKNEWITLPVEGGGSCLVQVKVGKIGKLIWDIILIILTYVFFMESGIIDYDFLLYIYVGFTAIWYIRFLWELLNFFRYLYKRKKQKLKQ